MLRKFKYLFLAFLTISLLFSLTTSSIQAARKVPCPPNTPFVCKQQIQQIINNALEPFQTALDTLTGRTEVLEEKVRSLETENTELNNSVSDLTERVEELEDNISPTPLDVVFFNDTNILTNISQNSEWFEAGNFSELVFTYQCKAQAPTSEYGAEIKLIVSNDMSTFATAFTASKAECHSGGSVTVDVAGQYYQVWVGNNTNIVSPPMTVYAAGRFR